MKEPKLDGMTTDWKHELDLLKQELKNAKVASAVPHKFADVTAELKKIADEAEKQVGSVKKYVLDNNPKFMREKSFWDSVIETQTNLKRDAKEFHKLAQEFNAASKEVEEIRTQFESHREYLHELIGHIMRHHITLQEKKK